MKKDLIAFCRSIGIEYTGIAPVGPYAELAERWRKRLENNHVTGFEEKEFAKRIDAKLTLDSAKSIIVCLFPYFNGYNEDTNLSKSSISIDYHNVVKEKLELIASFLNNKVPNLEYKAFVDNGPLIDRYMAYLAGLGYFGVNAHLINDQYGSYVFIGYIINNYPFEPDQPLDRTCLQCKACVQSCPGCAITGDFDINPLRCKSYITQKKGELTEQDIEILNKSSVIFGCDICQDVCPHNSNIARTPFKEFADDLISSLDTTELSNISNKEFLKRYKKRAFSWRGKSILLRNHDLIKQKKD